MLMKASWISYSSSSNSIGLTDHGPPYRLR
jgi:hypothetical protein